MELDKIIHETAFRARWVFVGMAIIVLLNSFDHVVTVNVWPSVFTAHGSME